jgi:FAD/FMN-containing dehydrogenase
VVGVYPNTRSGCAAVLAAMSSGIVPSALEYLDRQALEISAAGFPGALPDPSQRGFVVIAEADGDAEQAAGGARELHDALSSEPGVITHAATPAEVAALWRWRDGLALLADAHLGGKVSEDVAVPVDRLEAIVAATGDLARRHRLEPCSWGHAGDGNVHATWMFPRDDEDARARADAAAQELFGLAIELGGTVSGEHGVGLVKNRQLRRQWPAAAVALHEAVKATFDPRNLLNPGKKLP